MRAGSAADDALAARREARQVCSAREIARALQRMADAITADLEGSDPIVLAVMHGGAFAAIELCRRLRFPYELDFVHVTRYARGTRGGEIEWRVRPSAELVGRTVLVVDDVLDRGHTLRALGAELKKVGVARQRTAVLVVKKVRSPRGRPKVDYRGVEVEDVYLFGCGMDYRGYWRGLPAVYALASAKPRPAKKRVRSREGRTRM
jgi:hypoxanthine phosphoribosyltransferase